MPIRALPRMFSRWRFTRLAQLGRRIQQQTQPHAPNRRPQRCGVLAVPRGHETAREEGSAVDGGLEESRGNVGVGLEEHEALAEQLLRRRAAEIGPVSVGGEEGSMRVVGVPRWRRRR